MALYFVLAIVVACLFYIIFTYNQLVRLRNNVEEAFSTMDIYLKKRWSLIPNLVETVKGYSLHENETFRKIVELRSSDYFSMSRDAKLENEQKISNSLGGIFALSEAYPELKANENYMQLSSQLAKLEEDIANSRKYYNATVRNLNNKVETAPSNLIAGMFKVKKMKMFEIESDQREDVGVKLT